MTIKRALLFLFVCMVILAYALVGAEVKVFEREESAIVGQDQSQNQVQSMLREKAKIAALEEAGTYIATLTVVENYQLKKDEITALAAGVVSTRNVGIPIFEPIDGGRHVKIKVKFRIDVDTSVLDRQIEALMKDKGALKREEEAMKKVRELQEQLTNLKSSEVKRLEELNNQALAVEREREKQRLFREEQVVKAKGELSKAEADRIAKEHEMYDRIGRTLAEQEKAKRSEAVALAAEQDRIRRASLENEQRLNDLSRQAKLSQESWVAIDDSLSLKQAISEVKDLKREIANMKDRLDYQYNENMVNLKNAYAQQISLTTASLPPKQAPKGDFETTADYNYRIAIYDRQVKQAESENDQITKKLRKEEEFKLAEVKAKYLGLQIRMLEPFIMRLQNLQSRKFTLSDVGNITVKLGKPDADNHRFPVMLEYNGKSWNKWWEYTNPKSAEDFYSTRTHLKAEGSFQVDETTNIHPIITMVKVTHLATKEAREFDLDTPKLFAEIVQFNVMRKENSMAVHQVKAIENEIVSKEEAIKLEERLRARHVIKTDGRFVAYNDETVLDTGTGLMWASKDNDSAVNWHDAKSYCENYSVGGYSNWRMPTLEELKELYDYKRNRYDDPGQYLKTKLITMTQIWIWSSDENGSRAAAFDLSSYGEPMWMSKSSFIGLAARHRRVLPVRFVSSDK